MRRCAVIIALAGLLTGCWGAETQLFGRADWVQPEGLEGRFESEDAGGQATGWVTLAVRPDGRIDGTVTRKDEDAPPQTSPVGMVRIPGGSGPYLLMVQRGPEDKGGEFYLVARWQDGRLDAYWPQCAGTPDLPGMLRQTIELVNETVCRFADKDAVLRAALLAERELETKRMFAPQLLGRLKRENRATAADAATDP